MLEKVHLEIREKNEKCNLEILEGVLTNNLYFLIL